MSEDDTSDGLRIQEGQNRIKSDLSRVQEYGRGHPEEWVGVRFDNGHPVRVVAAFTGHVESHGLALRSLVEHPDLVAVEHQPYSAAQQDRILDELREQLFYQPRPLAIGMGKRWSGVFVQLLPTAEEVARQVHERYGDAVEINLGALPYPPRPTQGCPPRPEPTIAMDDVELRLVLDQRSVPTGDDATGRVVVRPAGTASVELKTGEPMVGMLLAGDGRVAGVYTGGIAGVGRHLRLAPGEEASVSAIVGTASCCSRTGYTLPPGRYWAVVPLQIYGRERPPGRRFDLLLPPPSPLVLTWGECDLP